MTKSKENIDKSNGIVSEEEFNKILNLIKSVKYGSITLIIHDGKVVQIEKNTKMRLS